MDIGINYITELDIPQNRYDNVYKFLINKEFINTIKFPGKYCNYETLENVILLSKNTNAKIDIHGFPGIVPAISSKKFLENVEWEKLNTMISQIPNFTRISTHMGLENKDRIFQYDIEELEKNWNLNIKRFKDNIQKILRNNLQIGLENIPGGFEFDIKTIEPDFINANWKNADFGVFDISHAKLSAKALNMTYENYLQRLEYKQKVKIIHISGNIDETNKYKDKPDKHVLINEKDIYEIIQTLKIFDNIDLVVSEYAYNTKYTYPKELAIESIMLFTIVKTMRFDISNNVLKYLEENLEEDISNIEEVVSYIEKKIK